LSRDRDGTVLGKGTMRSLLRPVAAVYEGVIRLRWQAYASGLFRVSRLRHPVISIGNLTMGGTGKTPITIALARFLQDSGHRVAVLLRGYGGNHRGKPLLVSDGQRILSTAKVAGDEALVLAENLPQVIVAVAKDRAKAGAWIEQRFEVDVHLLDDGFQHLRLHRDLNLLLIDATNPFGRGLPPLGRLREPPQAITRADAVVLTQPESNTDTHLLIEEVQKFKPTIPCFIARRRLASARLLVAPMPIGAATEPERSRLAKGDFKGRKTHRPDDLPAPSFLVGRGNELSEESAEVSIQTLRESRALAFAGIANPRQFFGMLQQHGIHFRDSIGFHDHHDYTKADYQRLKARCQSLAIDTLITTEKDAVKLDPLALSPLKVVVVKIAFEVDDLEALRRMLSTTVRILT
jgi:tetraacyldisaccharide 4'-kinase